MAKLFGAHVYQDFPASSTVCLSPQYVPTLWGSVGKDFVYHACGHEFESSTSSLLSDYRYRGMAKWFRAHYN